MSDPSISERDDSFVETAAPRKNPYGAFAIRAILGVAVVALLLGHYNARPVFHALARERIVYFVAAIALYLASQVMSSWRWQLLARVNSIPGPFREYLAYYFVGVFTNLFVPGLVGGDAARALYLGRRHNRLADAIASVIADRGIGLLALFWFAAGCALMLHTVSLPPSILHVTVTIGAAALAGWLTSPLLARLATRIGGRFARVIGPFLPVPAPASCDNSGDYFVTHTSSIACGLPVPAGARPRLGDFAFDFHAVRADRQRICEPAHHPQRSGSAGGGIPGAIRPCGPLEARYNCARPALVCQHDDRRPEWHLRLRDDEVAGRFGGR